MTRRRRVVTRAGRGPRVLVVLSLAFVLASAPAPARAAPRVINLPRTLATLTVDAPWVEQPAATSPTSTVLELAHPRGVRVVLTRTDAPNPQAWRAATREAYVDELERGFAAAPGYRRGKRTVTLRATIPTVDLRFERRLPDGTREQVVVRLLLYRTYTLALAAAGPTRAMRAARRDVDRLVTSLAQPAPPS